MESINWNIIFGIAGILGLLIGIYGVYLTIRYHKEKKRPNQFKYIPGEFFNIYKTLLSNRFNLDIKYKDKPITNNIFYISGKIVVKGDIKTYGNEITIELPKGYKWIDTSKEQSHPAINVEFEKDKESPQNAILTFNKLRQEDYINIGGVVEGEPLLSEDTAKSDFQKRIKFSHRIDDTNEKITIENYKKTTQSYKVILIKLGALFVFAITFMFSLMGIMEFRDHANIDEIMLFVFALCVCLFSAYLLLSDWDNVKR